MSEFVSVTVKHITQSLSQPAALNHPVKHTHTKCLWEKEEHLSSSHQFVCEGNHVSGSPLT